MNITMLNGIQSDNDVLQEPDKIEAVWEADGSIGVGKVAMHDTGFTDGRGVVIATAAADHRAVGVYEGKGGSGSATTTSGLTGNDAADADIILVTVYGHATAICDGGTNIADQDPLNISATNGNLEGEVIIDAGLNASFLALEACNTAGTVTEVFVKCL